MLYLLVFGLLSLQVCAGAATYKLPVKTATFVIPFDYYQEFLNGEPAGPYEFYIDPPRLRAGYDLLSGLVYESAIIFDWSEFPEFPEGTIAYASLHLTAITLPLYDYDYLMPELFDLDHSVPQPSDFDWLSQYGGGVISIGGFDPRQPDVQVFGGWPVHREAGYRGWILTTAGTAVPGIEIAGAANGLALEAPYILVTTVPEPSSAVCLVVAILSFGAISIRSSIRRRAAIGILSVAIPVLLAGLAMADDEVCYDSDPVGGACAQLASPPMPASGELPSDYTVLPAFPHFWWSYGCMPTCGAMIVGYYDNAGFPNMCRQKLGDDDQSGYYVDYLCPTGNPVNDNGVFLKEGDPAYMFRTSAPYGSRCAMSASEAGVWGRGATYRGHVDDYVGSPSPDPYYNSSPPWTPHEDDSVADFMGTSIYKWRFCSDGNTWGYFYWSSGLPRTWVPPQYPYPNVGPSYRLVDATYGLARYMILPLFRGHPKPLV